MTQQPTYNVFRAKIKSTNSSEASEGHLEQVVDESLGSDMLLKGFQHVSRTKQSYELVGRLYLPKESEPNTLPRVSLARFEIVGRNLTPSTSWMCICDNVSLNSDGSLAKVNGFNYSLNSQMVLGYGLFPHIKWDNLQTNALKAKEFDNDICEFVMDFQARK